MLTDKFDRFVVIFIKNLSYSYHMQYISYPKESGKEDVKAVGGKAANLAELIKADFPVPECFFVNVAAYQKFIEENNLQEKILGIIKQADISDFSQLQQASQEIKSLIMNAKMLPAIKNEILKAYSELSFGDTSKFGRIFEMIKAGREQAFVAIRSSAATEDIEKASAAGQHETFLNVRGPENVCMSVQKCWASLFTPRAIYYREKHRLPHEAGIGVIVQRMLNADRSGVMFTVNPSNPEDKNITIEAVWGLGETIVQGEVTPDRYVVDKNTGKILERQIGKKIVERIRDATGATIKRNVSPEKAGQQVLSDMEILVTAAYGKKIEQHYNFPQDIEFAVERGRIYIVQTRAVTFFGKGERPKEEKTGEILLKGLGASPGIAAGAVKIIKDLGELGKIQSGDILVTEMTSPDFVPAMEKSSAIVTNKGGQTCHASIVSRELGIPCIVATGNATEILKEGQEITVDATKGVVYSGKIELAAQATPSSLTELQTATKVKVNLAFPDTATEELARRADGVGLLRIEHMLTKSGVHPMEYIRSGRAEELTSILLDGIGKIAKVFYPKPVWVRTLDARTDEFRNMRGGEAEPTESNPMLGWHGIRRSLDEPDILRAEFAAIKKLHENGLTNVAVMLPFVISVSELRAAKEIAQKIVLPPTVKFGIMVETPAAALAIDEFCKEGIDFISFGTNDLCQLTLGIDRNNEKLSKLFDEMHPAMLTLLKQVIETCKKYNVESSICGEAGSRQEMVEKLIEFRIDSVSANIDAVDRIRAAVAEKEKQYSHHS